MLLSFSAADYAQFALRKLGVIDATRPPAPEDLANVALTLNMMIDAWALERRLLYYVNPARFPLQTGIASYTIGTGGTFNVERPVWLENWSIVPDRNASPVLELPIGRVLTVREYQHIPAKATQASFPTSCYYDHSWAAGLGRLFVYPVPNSNSPDLILYLPTALSGFADLTTKYSFPPGYARTIWSNLCVEIGPDYPGTLSDDVRRIAVDSKAWAKRGNVRPAYASIDPAIAGIGGRGSRYDPYTDT